MTDSHFSTLVEHTPLLCESCLKLYPAAQHHCPNCVDEPLLDISKDEVRHMLEEMDRQTQRKTSHRYLSLSIVGLSAFYAMVLLVLAIFIGKQLLLLLINPVGLIVFILSFAFFCLLSEKLLMNIKPPRRIASAWTAETKILTAETTPS